MTKHSNCLRWIIALLLVFILALPMTTGAFALESGPSIGLSSGIRNGIPGIKVPLSAAFGEVAESNAAVLYYAFDSKKVSTTYRVDTDGYLHFYTAEGGCIIISDGALVRK